MTTPELIFFLVTEALMTICVISHILIATVWKRKGVRLFFCIFSAIIVCLCVAVAFVIKGVFTYEPFSDIIKSIGEAPYLVAALAVVASCSFTGSLYLLRKKKQKAQKAAPVSMGEMIEYELPDNTRKKDERKHIEYKIIKENK